MDEKRLQEIERVVGVLSRVSSGDVMFSYRDGQPDGAALRYSDVRDLIAEVRRLRAAA